MEFLSLEAEEENDNFLHFSDDNFEKETDELFLNQLTYLKKPFRY